ncbi:alkaline phosphatase family protein [Mycobacterium sp. OTB74]|jgi:phospholipase C|uniref:alkaline phosphatase family protein n=1 Tax=Mycobacterium sp. OTB74 TaxID=1853452 RepID=UPI00247584F9|nr:alkaline phosphatase family protein [Mycobacterium sp. OTB74]MDH6244438.1 phospholipase C [Mycobacterium sp. OTB74]
MAGLDSIDHVILLMLENRSFDHMLGYLYPKSSNFDGLDGTESNRDLTGAVVSVYPITPDKENAYYYPLANPAEGFIATNEQLFSTDPAPASGTATNDGFVTSFAGELANPSHPLDPKLVGAQPSSIMGSYSPETLPVLSGLAKGFAVCDRWFASVPTQTFPNRAFAVAGTSLGYTDNSAHGLPAFDTPSVFGKLADAGQTWTIYGYSKLPLTANDFPDTVDPGPGCKVESGFDKFRSDVASGQLAAFNYIEPEWATYPRRGAPPSTTQADNEHNFQVENDQHPVSNLAVGEQLIYDVYTTLTSNQAVWEKSLLIITYDEHGGTYDHVAPDTDATPPDNIIGEPPFDFTRFGVRVPAVIVSPLIPPGTVFRAPAGSPPYDHTSIIATLRARFNLGALGNRDAIAPHLGPVLTLSTPRDDDPLKGVTPPTAADPVLQDGSAPIGEAPSAFLQAKAMAAATLPVPSQPIQNPQQTVAGLSTAAKQFDFIQDRLHAWQAAGKPPVRT